LNRILFHAGELCNGRVRLSGTRGAHLSRTLRARPDMCFRVGMIDGPRGRGRVTVAAGDSVELEVTLEPAPPARPRRALLLALPRPKVLRRLWPQLAALGLDRIVLTRAARVERNYFDSHWLKPEHYVPLLIDGLSQAGDTLLPEVEIVRRFRPFVEDRLDAVFEGRRRLVAHPGPRGAHPHVLCADPREPMVLAVGPEGGWTPFEMGMLEERAFERVSLGARTLRTDTACVALLGALGLP
jgi:RsmE family RNA methyltransferase